MVRPVQGGGPRSGLLLWYHGHLSQICEAGYRRSLRRGGMPAIRDAWPGRGAPNLHG